MDVHGFQNFGYIIDNVPYPLISQLKEIISEKQLESYNSDLAGNIKKEFKIPKAIPVMNDYMFQLVQKYENTFNYIPTIKYCTTNVPLKLNSMWVNFQEKHEFNPIHDHSGVFSFALWLQVPYYIEEEIKHSPGKESNHNVAGHFGFLYTNSLGGISVKTLPVDKRWEGKIAFFPAKLNHLVYPFFTSEDYRISISGNLRLDTNN